MPTDQFALSTSFGMHSLPLLRSGATRSISAENPTGAKGAGGRANSGPGAGPARHLGHGWKISPCILLGPHERAVLADVEGPGVVQHIWITTDKASWRKIVLRMWWDGEETPSVEAPLGDFFAQGWNEHAPVSSIPVAVNTRGALNCYWPMPFRRHARIEVENLTEDDLGMFFHQITYTLTEVPEDAGTFHAQFRRTNPLPRREVYRLLDGVSGRGHYVGTYTGWQANSTGWWGEGELKFYMDGDGEYPTICGTGTEDYFGGAWGFEDPPGTYVTYTTPFLGFHQHVGGGGQTRQGRRFGLYRWHLPDPIVFESSLRITMQALGIAPERGGMGRYWPLRDDICSVAFWYQTEPHAPFPPLPAEEDLEII